MKYVVMAVLCFLFGSYSMAQEMAEDVESSMAVETVTCSDGTDPDAACINLNAHPTLDQTGELLTLLLEKEFKKAQAFCDQSKKQCLSAIAPYFRKTIDSYTLRSVKLVEDDDLSVQSTVEAKIMLGDEKNKNQYTFVFEYQRQGINKLWKITDVYLKDTAPMTSDDDFGGIVMDAVGE